MSAVLLGRNRWTVLLVPCHGSGAIGAGDPTRVTRRASCHYVGRIVNGTVKLLYAYGLS